MASSTTCLGSYISLFGKGTSATGDTKVMCSQYMSITGNLMVAGYSYDSALVTLGGATSRPFIAKYDSSLNLLFAK